MNNRIMKRIFQNITFDSHVLRLDTLRHADNGNYQQDKYPFHNSYRGWSLEITYIRKDCKIWNVIINYSHKVWTIELWNINHIGKIVMDIIRKLQFCIGHVKSSNPESFFKCTEPWVDSDIHIDIVIYKDSLIYCIYRYCNC